MHGIERGDPQDDVQTGFLVKVAKHFTRLIGVKVSHHNGLDLRVLEADHVGHGTRSIHLRLSRPLVLPPSRIRSIRPLALSSPRAEVSILRI